MSGVSAKGTRREIILFVHGTNSADRSDIGQRWWQRESSFWKDFCELVGGDFDVQPEGEVFHWTGLNSEAHRQSAANELANQLQAFEQEGRPYHLIGHSHGGSVVWLALKKVFANRGGTDQLRSWATVGTPFLHFRPRKISLWWMLAGAVALFAFVFSVARMRTFIEVFSQAYSLPSGMPPLLLVLPVLWTIPIIVLLLLLVRLAVFVHATRATSRDFVAGEKAHAALAERYVGIWCGSDEAISGLVSTLALAGPVTPRWQSPYSSLRGWIGSVLTSPLRTFYNGVLSRASDEFVWNRLKRRMQGCDRPAYVLAEVTRGPLCSRPEWPEIPLSISDELVGEADKYAATTLSNIRNVLGLAATSDWQFPSLVTAIRGQFHSRELVHTLYFSNKNICRLLSMHVLRWHASTDSRDANASDDATEAWLMAGSRRAGESLLRGAPLGGITPLPTLRMLSALGSVSIAALLTFAWLISSAIYNSAVYPFTNDYQLSHIAQSTVALRSTTGGDIVEYELDRWGRLLTKAGYSDRALADASKMERPEHRLTVVAAVTHELALEGQRARAT